MIPSRRGVSVITWSRPHDLEIFSYPSSMLQIFTVVDSTS